MATATQDRAVWLENRRKGLGGSDIAAIMGLSPFKSPMDVYLDKIGEATEQEESPYLYWGNQLEDLVAREFAKQTGYKVQRRTQQYQHPAIPYLIGNIDRLVVNHPGGPAILDCKTTNAFKARDWDNGQAPLPYVIQIQHYLDITGYQQGYLAVLIGGNDFRIVPVTRDEAFIGQMHEASEAFWLCVQTATPPLVDGSAATTQALNLLYPQDDGSAIDLPPDAAQWIAQRERAKAVIKEHEALLTEAENHLKALLGDAKVGTCGGYSIIWDTRSRKGFDTKGFKASHPDLYAQFKRDTPYRTLNVKEAK